MLRSIQCSASRLSRLSSVSRKPLLQTSSRYTLPERHASRPRGFHSTPLRRARILQNTLEDPLLAQALQNDGASKEPIVEDLATVLERPQDSADSGILGQHPDLAEVHDNIHFGKLFTGLPHSIFEQVHDTPIIWAASIPIAAVLIRILASGIIAIISGKNRRRMQAIRPFELAFNFDRLYEPKQSQRSMIMHGWISTVRRRYRAKSHLATLYGLINIPVWLATIEALRSMVGTRYGLFGLVLRSLGYPVPESNVMFPDWTDSTMKTEGILWFSDLTMADPYGVLSVALGLALSTSIYRSTKPWLNSSFYYERDLAMKFAMRGLPAIGLIMIPLTNAFPSALLLYWITTTISAPWIVKFTNLFVRKPVSHSIKSLQDIESTAVPHWLVLGLPPPKKTSSRTIQRPYAGGSRGRMR